MATIASTILIEGKKFDRDAELLKNLNLGKKLRAQDQHRIGKANVHYHTALNARDEVFVSTLENHTLLCSDYIPSDFVGGFSTLKSGVFDLFPEGRKLVFFSNSTSMLNGFIIFEGQKVRRLKVVQDGKHEKVSGDILDFGELLDLELEQYKNEKDVKKSYDYLWGLYDLDIAYKYIEKHFGISDFDSKLDQIICNQYTSEEISDLDISKANEAKIEVKQIHDSINQIIESNFEQLKKVKTKDDFPQVSRKNIYTLNLNHHTLTIHNSTNFQPPSGTNSRLIIYLNPKENIDIFKDLYFYKEELGLTIFQKNAHEFLLDSSVLNERIVSQYDFNQFKDSIDLKNKIPKELLFGSTEETFINNDDYFLTVFENLKNHSENKGWIQGYDDVNILLARIFFEHKTNSKLLLHNKLLNFLHSFDPIDNYFGPKTKEKIKKHLAIISKIEESFTKKIEKVVIKPEKQILEKPTNKNNLNRPDKKWWEFWK